MNHLFISLMAFLNAFIFITILIHPIHAQKACKSSKCNNDGFQITYPFFLPDQQDKTCGYPGFDLTCTSQGTTAIDLPSSGRFFVRNINYESKVIKLYDPNQCLARRLLQLDLSGSPFMGKTYRNYYFFNCPSSFFDSPYTINCLSNSTNYVLALYISDDAIFSIRDYCKEMAMVSVPSLGYDQLRGEPSLFNELWLTWNGLKCEHCDHSGVLDSKTIAKVVFLTIGILVIVFGSCLISIRYCTNITWREINTSLQQGFGSGSGSVNPTNPHEVSRTTRGLDDSTIQSYTKVVLGESRRIPGINDGTCPICLSEFLPKETLRCIPDCKHCFHVDCIDEWLRLNRACPICRSSPTQVDIVHPTINSV